MAERGEPNAPLVEPLSRYQPCTDVEAADVERVWSLISSGDPWQRSASLHVTGSALIVHRPTRRVLLRWHLRQRAWLQVGGHADPREVDPLAIAIREGREETGLTDLTPWPDAAIVHVVIPPRGRNRSVLPLGNRSIGRSSGEMMAV